MLIPTKIPTDSPAVTERSLVTLGARCPSGGAERGIFSETWGCWGQGWSPRQESNLYLALRRRLFYPLNYGERIA